MFGEENGRFSGAGDKHTRHVHVVPVFRGHVFSARERRGQTGFRRVVLEVKVTEILIGNQSAAIRPDRQQVEFAGEIEVSEQAITRLEVLQPG